MKLIYDFYYKIECSGLYLQRKIWGRFFRESSGLILVNLTISLLVIVWLFIANNYLLLSSTLSLGICLFLLITMFSYNLAKPYKLKTTSDKLENFEAFSQISKWIYLTYSALFMVALPLLILIIVLIDYVIS